MPKFKTFFITLILLGLTSNNVLADVGFLWMRGEAWGRIDKSDKTFYLQGVLDGIIFSEMKVQGVKIATNTSVDHLIVALNQFYSDYRNVLIPVPFALKIISQELSGVAPAEIKFDLIFLRQQFKK